MFRTSRPIRYINQNLGKVIGSILAFAFILLIIHMLNNWVKIDNEKKKRTKVYTVNDIKQVETNYVEEKELKNTEYNITQYNLKSEKVEAITNFIDYCNNKEIQKAYDLLTEECKKILYPTQKEFEEKYYKPIFTNKKTFNLSYISSDNNLKTYKLEILDDILTMGKFDETKVHEELITIVQEETTEKLNINNFIKVEEINKTETTENLVLTVNKRYIYADYEKYEIDVFNATEDYLKLDPLEIEKTAFLLDSNNKMIYIDRNKMSDVDVQIYPYTNRDITIYFSKKYIEGSTIKSINFICIEYKNNGKEVKDKIGIELTE